MVKFSEKEQESNKPIAYKEKLFAGIDDINETVKSIEESNGKIQDILIKIEDYFPGIHETLGGTILDMHQTIVSQAYKIRDLKNFVNALTSWLK